MKRTLLLFIFVLVLLAQPGWFIHVYAQRDTGTYSQALTVSGTWGAHNYDLVYTVAFSSEQQPNGPLVVYRASESDLRSDVAVIALARDSQPLTPLFFPSPNGQFLALLTSPSNGYGANVNDVTLRILSTDGEVNTLLVPGNVAAGDQVVWSPDSQALYYHSGMQQRFFNMKETKRSVTATLAGIHSISSTTQPVHYNTSFTGYDEIHRVDLRGHDVTLLHRLLDDSSLRLVGLDRSGGLILTWARPRQPVALVRLDTNGKHRQAPLHSSVQGALHLIATLPPDILPGNVLRIGSDGTTVECERVLSWQPLRYTLVRFAFEDNSAAGISPIFEPSYPGREGTALNRSNDGHVVVMSQVMSVRHDLAVQGIAGVPAQEALLVSDANSGASQRLILPPGGQIVQTFWTPHLPMAKVHNVSPDTLAGLFAAHYRLGSTGQLNASVFQQDEWMLEGHAGKLFDSPPLPSMCYGYCAHGATGPPHVSAAILHGVAYVESNWHQFNAADYRVNGEPIGSPVKSFDGGWGEYQQTWGMPPQCQAMRNCRSDVSKIQYDQSYNIGTGVQSLISAWNHTAGVVSATDPNDPYKANHWFFAVWAYNGASGNNPNDVPSSVYKHWYPGAPFRSIYEEYVWYFAAHPQYHSNGWTDNYLPGLGSSLLPPQSDFAKTTDSFVGCVTCTIPDWTTGTFDRDWVGVGAPNTTTADYFKTLFVQSGGENVVGLPRDNGGGAAVHRWGPGWVQDFGGGSYLPGTFMLLDNTTTPYWVYGGVWRQYMTLDHGVSGCHAYPTSVLNPFSDPGLGPDTYLRQNFQRGYIIWDATTQKVAADVCR